MAGHIRAITAATHPLSVCRLFHSILSDLDVSNMVLLAHAETDDCNFIITIIIFVLVSIAF